MEYFEICALLPQSIPALSTDLDRTHTTLFASFHPTTVDFTMSAPTNYVYKILSSSPPLPIPRTFTPVDASDGFVHLSSGAQVPATASRFFGSETKIWLVKIDLKKLENGPGEVKWEESMKHGVFAHLYGADIEEQAVVSVDEKTRMGEEGWEEILKGLEE